LPEAKIRESCLLSDEVLAQGPAAINSTLSN